MSQNKPRIPQIGEEVPQDQFPAIGEEVPQTAAPQSVAPQAPDEPHSLGGFAKNLLPNLGENVVSMAKGLGSVGKGVFKLARGAVSMTVPKSHREGFDDEAAGIVRGLADVPRQMADMVLDRYGSPDKAKETLYHDPFGVVSDVSTFYSGAGPLLSGASKIPRVAGLTRTAGVMSDIGKASSWAGELTNPVRAVTAPVNVALKGIGTGLSHISVRPGTNLAKEAGGKYRIAQEVAKKGLWSNARSDANFSRAIDAAKAEVAQSNLPPTPRATLANLPKTEDAILKRPGTQMGDLDSAGRVQQEINRDLPDMVPIGDVYDFRKYADRMSAAVRAKGKMELPGGPTNAGSMAWKEAGDNARAVADQIPGMQDLNKQVQTAMLANGAVRTAQARPHALTRMLAMLGMGQPATAAGMILSDSPRISPVLGHAAWKSGDWLDSKALTRALLLSRMQDELAKQEPR